MDLLKLGKFNCIFPDSLALSDLSTLPFESMKADIPLLADLAIKIPSSIDR